MDEREHKCFDINATWVCLDEKLCPEKSFYPVLLPRLDGAYLFVVAVHVMVVQANDGGLSWRTQTTYLNMNNTGLGMEGAAVKIPRMTGT